MTRRPPSHRPPDRPAPPAADLFTIPDGLTRGRVERALCLLLEVSALGARQVRRVDVDDWRRLVLSSDRRPETVRTTWERAKSDLVKLGAPVRLERDGRRVVLVVLAGACEFAQATLDALARACPPPVPKAPPRVDDTLARAARGVKLWDRRQQVRQLRLDSGLSVRAIAAALEVSAATVHADLRALDLVGGGGSWERVRPGEHRPSESLEAIRQGVSSLRTDLRGRAAKRRLRTVLQQVEELAGFFRDGWLLDRWADSETVVMDFDGLHDDRSHSA